MNDVALAAIKRMRFVRNGPPGNDARDTLDQGIAALESQQSRIADLTGALENCRLYAAGSHKAYWACAILRFCSAGGITGSPLRDNAAPKTGGTK